MQDKYNLITLGGGASGLVSAITFKRLHRNQSAAVVERLSRVGKKLLVTGNGRCNLTNIYAAKDDYNDPDFVSFAMNKFTPQSNIEFFESLGILTTIDGEGRVYPYSLTSSSVLNAMRNECKNLGIDIITDTPIEKIEKRGKFFLNERLQCDKLIVAAGGKSSSVHGSDGSGFKLMKDLSHTIVTPRASLVQLCCENSATKQLKGIKIRGRLTLLKNQKPIGQSEGEILFTDYGISGIAALDLSYYVSKQDDFNNLKIKIDMAKDYSQREIIEFMKKNILRFPKNKCGSILTFILPQKASEVFVKQAGFDLSMPYGKIEEEQLISLSKILKEYEIKLLKTKGFDQSQVTSGGVSCSEFNKLTMESRKIKNLYCCGEILNVDARCGGYNLQWAISSGRLAGECN